VNTWLSSCQET